MPLFAPISEFPGAGLGVIVEPQPLAELPERGGTVGEPLLGEAVVGLELVARLAGDVPSLAETIERGAEPRLDALDRGSRLDVEGGHVARLEPRAELTDPR